ncbi:hypothetical protein ACWIUH_11690 [Ursidibacter arcticus]
MRNLSQEIQTLKAELESLLDDMQFCEEMMSKGNDKLAQKMLDCVYSSMKNTATTHELRQTMQGGRDE